MERIAGEGVISANAFRHVLHTVDPLFLCLGRKVFFYSSMGDQACAVSILGKLVFPSARTRSYNEPGYLPVVNINGNVSVDML